MVRYGVLIAGLLACRDKGDGPGGSGAGEERIFPEEFRWGSATAGFQVDMGCPTWPDEVCVDAASDWYQWVTTPEISADAGLHVTGEDPRRGPGMWELFEQDAAQMAEDGLTAFRMSVEWSRLFPDGAAESAASVEELAGYADADAVARYHEMLASLAENGLHPLVTLNHYTLPLWVHDGVACHADLATCAADGWVNGERIIPLIALYSGFVAQEFGGEIDQWATLNEPFATTLSGYLLPGEDRSAPPGLTLASDAVIATLRHQIEGHAAMTDAVRAYDAIDADGDGASAEVGVVLNMVSIHAKDPANPEDVAAIDHMDHLYHRLFLDGLTSGAWDDDLDGEFETTRDELAGRLDWIGINYYNRVEVAGWVPLIADIPVFDFLPEISWEPYPEGLGDTVRIASEYGLPIHVTENGTLFSDRAADVLAEHLASLQSAVEDGIDVRGYYYWSWVDNYEWNHGMEWQFGLYELDIETKARAPRPVLGRYQEIIAAGRVEP